jgi:hypothetical protein
VMAEGIEVRGSHDPRQRERYRRHRNGRDHG